MKKRESYYLLRAFPAIIILLFIFALPLFFVFLRAFDNDAEAIKKVFTDRYTYKLLGFTLYEAFLSACISVIVALPFAAFFSRYSFFARKAILTISQLAFTIPSILVVLAFVIWYGNAGVLNNLLKTLFSLEEPPLKVLYSFKAILLSHVYLNFPIAFSLITAAWSKLPEKEEISSKLMGKSNIKTFFSITLPKIRGTIIASWILIFLFCFSSFSIVLVLGGKPSYYTIEAEIYKRTYTDTNPSGAAALALFSFLITSLLLFITSGGRRERKQERTNKVLIKAKGKTAIIAFIISILILLFLLPPLLSIVYRAFFTKDGTFTLKAWQDMNKSHGLVSSSKQGIINSFLIALATAGISTLLARRIALASCKTNSRILPLLSSLPMATGSVALGLGFSFVSAYIYSEKLLVSYLLVLLSHLVITFPFAVRTILPGAKRIPENIALSSYTLGASKRRTITKVENPLLFGYMKKAFAFSFALSLGEVNATLTLAEGKVVTLPILIYRMIGSYNFQGAAALGTILLFEALIVFAIGEIKEDGIS